jgi:adenosylcobinamide amidohydrolase
MGAMHWEELARRDDTRIRRYGRFLVADLLTPHDVISTSARNGGVTQTVRHLVNHQSCEGSGHESRAHAMTGDRQESYHEAVCVEVGLDPAATVLMGTAANMHYAALVTAEDEDVAVTAVVTAGVHTNATCAGDPAPWRETADGISKVPAIAGTINTILCVSAPVTPAALARTVVTMTEGKSAALQRLAAPSCFSPDLATGTGTDQFAVAAPLTGRRALTSASPHMKFGELVGRAVRDATLEALRWQNGLEPSYTRGVFHALGRHGVREATIFEDLAPWLEAADLELLRRNGKAAFYEPLAGAAAHAFATVIDRVRHGALPASIARDALVQQAASLAVGLAAQPDRWAEFRSRLHADASSADPRRLALAAIAVGWSEKWRSR